MILGNGTPVFIEAIQTDVCFSFLYHENPNQPPVRSVAKGG